MSWPSPDRSGRVTLRASEAAAGWSGKPDGISYRIDVLESVGTTEGAQRHVTLRVSLDGISRVYRVSSRGDLAWVNDGTNSQTFRSLPRFADLDLAAAGGGPSAPVPGTVVSVEVAAGDEVAEGQTLVVLEAMKMEHRITAAAAGVVDEVLVRSGDSVDAHQVLVTLQ
ncbi:MAG: biotin/lipoyl-containing protein [Candidatus Nanopelagicales bacterium]